MNPDDFRNDFQKYIYKHYLGVEKRPHRLRTIYDGLPEEAKDQFMEIILKAILWRGWDQHGGILGSGEKGLGSLKAIMNLCELLQQNGFSMEEYT